MSDVVLAVEGLRKSFGGMQVINGVSFELSRGQVLGLIGPNGAGKTTIFNLINGIYRLDAGVVALAGEEVSGAPPAVLARKGLARTFQVPRTFNEMTIEENLIVPLTRSGLSVSQRENAVETALEMIRLEKFRTRRASQLSAGQRKLLELARAILLPPRVLLLDEPFSGASVDIIDRMLDIIKNLAGKGTSCLVISHDVASMPRLCEDIIVLVSGAVMTKGKLTDVKKDPAVIEVYLGGG